ncbi:MAG: lamin tail domain-containing protein [Anaerolineales bacterium]
MNQAKKLLFYLVLNVIVSAVTILAVLFIWEKTHLKDVLLDTGGGQEAVSAASEGPAPTEDTGGQLIQISEVGGIGNLATEYVRLTRPNGDPEDTVSLQNWKIKDENNHEYVILEQSGLPSLELHGQGAVNIYTKEGSSNPIELSLGLSDAIWQPGETVSLIDPEGNVHDTYIIP